MPPREMTVNDVMPNKVMAREMSFSVYMNRSVPEIIRVSNNDTAMPYTPRSDYRILPVFDNNPFMTVTAQ